MPDKSFHCFICEKKFARFDTLTNHQNSMHKGIKYDCKDCDKSYSHEGNLRRHKREKESSYT